MGIRPLQPNLRTVPVPSKAGTFSERGLSPSSRLGPFSFPIDYSEPTPPIRKRTVAGLWLYEPRVLSREYEFKIGQCSFQFRPVRSETGQHLSSDEQRGPGRCELQVDPGLVPP
jgi:hypothetical protein